MEDLLTQIPSHFQAILAGIFIAVVCFNLDTNRASNKVATVGLTLSVILIVSGVVMYFT